MRARDILGRRITKVNQKRMSAGPGRGMYTDLNYIELDDGKRLIFVTIECDDGYGVECHVSNWFQRWLKRRPR